MTKILLHRNAIESMMSEATDELVRLQAQNARLLTLTRHAARMDIAPDVLQARAIKLLAEIAQEGKS